MFSGCTSLNTIESFAQEIENESCCEDWLKDVAASGTFYNYGHAPFVSGISGIPSGWTEVSE